MNIVQTTGIPNSQIVKLKRMYNPKPQQYTEGSWSFGVDYAEHPEWKKETGSFVPRGDGQLYWDGLQLNGNYYTKYLYESELKGGVENR